MPEWHKGAVGPDKRHRKMAQIPTDTRVIRDTRVIAATPATTAPASPTLATITPPPPLTPTEADTLYKAATHGLREVYLPSSPPNLEEDADSSRSTSPKSEPLLDRIQRALQILRAAEAAMAAAQAEVAAAVEDLRQSTTPGKPS